MKSLFKKVTLKNKVEVPTRLVIPPLTLFGSNADGTISKEEQAYLSKRGVGVGLYILGACAVSQEGLTFPCQPRALSEKDIPSLAERAKIVKSDGALAINQIHHGGLLALKELSGLPPVVPSLDIAKKELQKKGAKDDVKELNDNEIKKIINDFAYATELSIKSDYDGIEIHGANNFILQQFYSAYTNRRTDSWGGSDEKRMSFPLQIVDACIKVREKYKKPKFIIGYRLSPEEPYEGGITMTETLKLVRALVKKPIQYIHISEKNYFQEVRNGEGKGEARLKVIHKEIQGKVALIGVGGLITEKDFTNALKTGYSEFIGAGKASMVNKDLGNKLKKGEKLDETLDSNHPEKYSIPTILWNMCVSGGQDWLPPVKGKK